MNMSDHFMKCFYSPHHLKIQNKYKKKQYYRNLMSLILSHQNRDKQMDSGTWLCNSWSCHPGCSRNTFMSDL